MLIASPRTYVPPADGVVIPQWIQRLRPDLAADSDEYKSIYSKASETRKSVGPWHYDLMHGTRKPWNPVEELIVLRLCEPSFGEFSDNERQVRNESLRLEIESRGTELVTWPLMSEVRHWLECLNRAYAEVLGQVHEWHLPSASRSHTETAAIHAGISKSIDLLDQDTGLWKEELLAVFESVETFRAAHNLPLPTLGTWQHQSAIMLALEVFSKTSQHWKNCQEISDKSASGYGYTHFEPAVQLFWRWVQDAPRPNDIQAILGQEFSIAKTEIQLRDSRCNSNESAAKLVPFESTAVVMTVQGPVTIHNANANGQTPPEAPVEADVAQRNGKLTVRPKRSTQRGEGVAKCIAALTQHHQYEDGSCLNQEPIGNNELSRLAKVETSTASAFFKNKFGGYTQYKQQCGDVSRLIVSLKALNGELSPLHFMGKLTCNESDAKPDEDG